MQKFPQLTWLIVYIYNLSLHNCILKIALKIKILKHCRCFITTPIDILQVFNVLLHLAISPSLLSGFQEKNIASFSYR